MRALVLAFVLCLAGCGTINVPSIFPAPPKNTQIEKIKNTGCKEVIHADGTKAKLCENEYAYRHNRGEKPLSFWQTLTGGLSRALVIAIVGFGIFFATNTATAVAWLKSRKDAIKRGNEIAAMNAEKDKYKTALEQTVKGIEKAGGVEDGSKLDVSLSSEQDKATKALVKDILS